MYTAFCEMWTWTRFLCCLEHTSSVVYGIPFVASPAKPPSLILAQKLGVGRNLFWQNREVGRQKDQFCGWEWLFSSSGRESVLSRSGHSHVPSSFRFRLRCPVSFSFSYLSSGDVEAFIFTFSKEGNIPKRCK